MCAAARYTFRASIAGLNQGRSRAMTPNLRYLLFFIIALPVCLMARPAAADEFADAVNRLGGGNFTEQIGAIDRLSALADPRAVPVLKALGEANLYLRKTGGQVVITRGPAGAAAAIDPVTGADLGSFDAAAYDVVRINNRLRVTIRGALGRLMLVSPEPGERYAAAQGVFKTRSIDNLPLLERALATEKDGRVAAQLRISLAATQLLSSEPSVRLVGIAGLAQSSDAEVRGLLVELGAVAGIDDDTRRAAEKAITGIDERLVLLRLVQTIFQGLSLGSVLLLAAIGLAITFGVMGVINMAHGEMVMLGAYTTFVIQQLTRQFAPGAMEWSILIAIPSAFMVAGAFGVMLERGVVRHLYGRPLETLLMTWGLSMIIQQAVRTAFGASNREVGSPSWMSGSIEIAGGITITQNRIWIILFGLAVLAAVALVMRFTTFGLQMRAVTQNRDMAAAMGIRTNRIDALTFGLGSGIAGMAGVALSQIDNVSPNLGQSYIVDSFMVVVFGGVGNLLGTLFGASLLGIINKFLEPYAGAVLGKIFVLVAIIMFIQVRPRGLFALKGRAAEHAAT